MILLDTNVLIEQVRGTTAARDWLLRARRESGRMSISAVSLTEFTGGMRSEERTVVRRLLGLVDIVVVDELVAERAGELMRRFRRSHQGIGVVDYLIAASAQLHGMELATLNVKHFPMFDNLQPPFAV
jgi:predicted nucleic acid-binding protein